jgi:alpha-ketoglutarate-dependent taurine dioxygenase
MIVNPLYGEFGAEARGLDVAEDLDDATFKALAEALYGHRLLVIRGQRCDKEAYLRFGRRWGAPIPHVLDHMRMPGYPEMLVVGNTEEKDRKPEIRNGAALWHTDQSYDRVPASATMLYALQVPDGGGPTLFCDMAAAYDGLDAATKRRIDGLEVAHSYGAGKLRPDDLRVNPIINQKQRDEVPVTYHPLVLPHHVSGRPALYALGHGAHGIKGLPDDEAEKLLDGLKEHCLQPKYVHAHRYDVGDIAIWDTFQTMHKAVPIEVAKGKSDARLLWRISVRGKPDVYAQAA